MSARCCWKLIWLAKYERSKVTEKTDTPKTKPYSNYYFIPTAYRHNDTYFLISLASIRMLLLDFGGCSKVSSGGLVITSKTHLIEWPRKVDKRAVSHFGWPSPIFQTQFSVCLCIPKMSNWYKVYSFINQTTRHLCIGRKSYDVTLIFRAVRFRSRGLIGSADDVWRNTVTLPRKSVDSQTGPTILKTSCPTWEREGSVSSMWW